MALQEYTLQIRKYSKEKYSKIKQKDTENIFFIDKGVNMKAILKIITKVISG